MGGGFQDARHLEQELSSFINFNNVVLFPTGWGAGYGAIKALVRPTDYVLIDTLAHDCLQHGANGSTPNVFPFAHNDLRSLKKRLARIAKMERTGGILVVTESLFSMDSDHPDFSELIGICREYGATILVDVAHDLGVLGPDGRGVLTEDSVLDRVDIVIGSFSKTFACIGGFAATNSAGASCYLRGFSGTYTFSNFLIPAQVAAIRTALQIVRSDEGDALRKRVLANAAVLRGALREKGIQVLGRESPLVIAMIGSEGVARLAQRRCFENGLILNSIEFPACRRGEARFRLQLSPLHEGSMLEEAAKIVQEAVAWATAQ